MASVIGAECAIGQPDDDMSGDEAPGADATVGMFLDYLERRPNGVILSALSDTLRARVMRVMWSSHRRCNRISA